MADIELVIKISEEDFEIMKHNVAINNPLCPLSQEEVVSKIANGMPLDKYTEEQKRWIPINERLQSSHDAIQPVELNKTALKIESDLWERC